MNQIRKVTYRAGLFDPINLVTAEKIRDALTEFGAVLNEANHTQVIGDLFDQSHIVELILSGIEEEIPLREWILGHFPSEPKQFENSFVHKLLSKLSTFFLFYSSSADRATADLLRDHHQTVKLAPEVLRILFAVTFLEEDRQQVDVGRPLLSPTKKVKAKCSQRESKQAKRSAHNAAVIDEKPFHSLRVTVPKTRADADLVCSEVMHQLASILDVCRLDLPSRPEFDKKEVYLTGIRRLEIQDFIIACFIPQDRPEELNVVTQPTLNVDRPAPPAPTTEDVPSAFPMVQPMKSALYFDSPEGFGKWRILVSSQANNNLRDFHRRDAKIFSIIVKKIKELSMGFFSDDNQKRLCGPSSEVPIFEAKMTGDLRLVYQVDCTTDYDNSSEVQVLRLYGIFTHGQMDKRLWKTVSSYVSSLPKEYRSRCLKRVQHPDGGNIYLPALFSSSSESDEEDGPVQTTVPSLPADDTNELHHIISLEKYVTLSKELLDSIEADRETAFPFEVSKHERTIIQHPHSCYVLGRSGTGKTTTMLYKMLLVERDYQLRGEIGERPRQIFVTQSRVLASRVEEHFATYFSSLATASHTEYHFKSSHAKTKRLDDEDIFNEEDNAKWRNDLPARFSELEDIHFPLFITFDRLCTMIEEDMRHLRLYEEATSEGSSYTEPNFSAMDLPVKERKGKLVTFDRFYGEYWPHFSQYAKKGLYPSLVYNEIMGVISGSEGTVLSPHGYLDRDMYMRISSRVQPAYGDHRDRIYDLFISYRKIKNELDDFDITDRTHAIIRSYVSNPSMLQKIGYLYVDETQDNLLIDALLLRMLCLNSNGLFWAGDTAQTISAGSSFRFDDLKAFLHRIEVKRQSNPQTLRIGIKPKKPKMFHLSVNYRSHAGIVNCAHSIITIITKYWKSAIDTLPRERGKADGLKPVFYINLSPQFVQEGHFLSRNWNRQDKIELGANQCILVRDENAKTRLINSVGKIGIIITLYDSKGLEFNDVFLYNFFHDSPVDASQWRLVLNEIDRDDDGRLRLAAPTFDPTRHAALCSELKCLYVAITRARNVLRIADESLKGEPMRNLWESRGQIRSCEPGADLSDFAKASGQDEWAKRGKQFFDMGQYVHARESYEKAGKKQAAAVADAYNRREIARRAPAGGKDKSRDMAFQSAAEAFSACAKNATDPVAENDYLRISGQCYEEGGKLLLAAKTYRLGRWFTEAATLYRKLGKFDDVYEIITHSANEMNATILESVRDVTRLYYVSKEDYGKAHKLFETVEEEIDYLEDRDLDLAQLDLLLLHGRKREAAELHLAEGRLIQAIDLFLADENDKTSMSRAKDCLLQGLWRLLPFGIIPVNPSEVNELLERSRLLDEVVVDENEQDELTMFEAIISGQEARLSQLADSFLKRGNVDAAFLCLDHYFNQTPSLVSDDIEETTKTLEQFFDYIHILHDLAFLVDPSSNPKILKLFGVRPGEDEGTVTLSPESLVYLDACFKNPQQKDSLTLDKTGFVEAFRGCLRDRLLDRVTRENDTCRKAPALEPCLGHVAYGDCDGPASGCSRPHISPDITWFRHWIRAHLLQILIYHSITSIQFPAEMRSQQRFWIVKLYEALNPPHHLFGSTCNMVNVPSIAENRMAFSVLADWVRALSYSLEFHPSHPFLTIAMQTADLAFTFDKKEAAVYMYRSKFAGSYCPRQFIRREQGQNSLQELLLSYDQKGPSSILMGILFIRQVMDMAIPVNINVFCTFIERICGSLIVCNRYQWNGSLHKLILPRSWLTSILRHFDPANAGRQEADCYSLLLRPLNRLLREMYFPNPEAPGHLLYGPELKSLDRQGFRTRNLYIARICRILGLLGSNISFEPFRNDVFDILTSLGKNPENRFPRLYTGYVYAENFQKIVVATRRSMLNSPFDDMVKIIHSGVVEADHEIFGLQRIVYSKHEELLSLLDPNNQMMDNPSSPVAPQQPAHDNSAADEQDLEKEDNTDLLGNKAEFAKAAAENQNVVPETEIPQDMYIAHSEQETFAASVIQRTYASFKVRKRMMEEPGLAGAARRWFALFRKALQPSTAHCFAEYKLLYFGPLVHLLASLDSIKSLLLKKKAQLKKSLLRGIEHEELDKVGQHLTLVNEMLKRIKQYVDLFGPGALLHLEPFKIDALKKSVREAMDDMKRIYPVLKVSDELRVHLDIVYKGILQERKVSPVTPQASKKEKRPQLVMDDLMDLLEDRWENDAA